MPAKALFLDRDGIINIDHGYVYEKEKFEFTSHIFAIARFFYERGYVIFVVTNQSGIGRGYYTQAQFLELSQWMCVEFARNGIHIGEVYFCPHQPHEGCTCRKPHTGMVDQACKHYDIDLSGSVMVGDKPSDIEMAKRAGIGTSVYIGEDQGIDATKIYPNMDAFYHNLADFC